MSVLTPENMGLGRTAEPATDATAVVEATAAAAAVAP